MARKVKVVERKLKRERATGLAYFDEGLIEIDPRQKPREWLSTLIHEALHHGDYPLDTSPVGTDTESA